MTLLVGALTMGLILSLLAMGVYLSFRVFHFPDITVDGSITLGAAVAAVLAIRGVHPLVGLAVVFVAGMAAGAATGILHTKFGIHGLLSGILVMTALYSINLHVMGRSNVPLLTGAVQTSGEGSQHHETLTLPKMVAEIADRLSSSKSPRLNVLGWELDRWDAAQLVGSLAIVVLVGTVLFLFLRTNLGTAMRATGDNADMMRAQGVNVGNMIVFGLALSNGLVAMSGALLAQFQGFADVQLGIGMVVWGLASVIIGEALVRQGGLGLTIVGAVMGSILFRLLLAIALRWGLNPNDLKLVTSLFVFAALVLPDVLNKFKRRSVASYAPDP